VALGLGAGAWWLNNLTTPAYRVGEPTTTALPWTPPVPVVMTPAPQVPTPESTATPTGTASPTPGATTAAPQLLSDIAIDAVSGSGTLHRFIVQLEPGVSLAANDLATEFAAVLNDPRSWTGSGDVRFSVVKQQSKAAFTVYFVGETTATLACGTAPICFKSKMLTVSAKAWATLPSTQASLDEYHTYLVNHGAGLVLKKKVKTCAGKGKKASVMQEQWSDLGGCKANPWAN
jgi:hypothetical protein